MLRGACGRAFLAVRSALPGDSDILVPIVAGRIARSFPQKGLARLVGALKSGPVPDAERGSASRRKRKKGHGLEKSSPFYLIGMPNFSRFGGPCPDMRHRSPSLSGKLGVARKGRFPDHPCIVSQTGGGRSRAQEKGRASPPFRRFGCERHGKTDSVRLQTGSVCSAR